MLVHISHTQSQHLSRFVISLGLPVYCTLHLHPVHCAVEFYFFKLKIVFEPPFRGLRGNVRTPTPSMTRWKARGQLSISHS